MPDDQQQQTPPIDLSNPAALTAAYQKYLEYLQQVGNQRPAQAPQVSQADIEANKPTSLLGQIGEGLAGGPPIDVPMSAAQREAAGTRALFNFSRGLLGTGTFDTIGQALARGETEAERGQYSQEAQIGYQQAAAQDWQRQQMADRLAALKESIPLLQGIQRLNMPSLYGPGGGPGAQAGNAPGSVPGAPGASGTIASVSQTPGWSLLSTQTPEMQAMIQKAAAASGMPVELLAGHKWNESRTASSVPAGDGGASVGIMQMQQGALDTYNKAHNTSYTQQDLNKDPQLALNVGAGYWMQLRQKYGSDFLASMAYARGPGATDTWIKNGSKAEDLPDGVRRVLGNIYGPGSFSGANPIPEALQVGGGGKPYQVAGPVVAPPSQPPAQPAGRPPAPAGGTDTAALPVPPQPPPGAVPTVSTPEEATATATAANTPVQVPGGQGLYALPGGGVTSTPRLIMPGTQVASLTPTAPTTPTPAPPPGAVPPAQQPPAQAQQPPASAATPAPQAPDIKAQKPDGTYVVPDEKLSLPQFQDRYRHVYSPEELQQRGLVLPDNPTALQTAYAGVQEAEAEARAARQTADNAQRSLLPPTEVAKAIDAANGADKNAQAARQAYTAQIQGANEKNAAALQTAYQEQDRNLAAAYKDVLDRQQKQALQTQAEQAAVSKSGQDVAFQVDKKRLDNMTDQATSAHDTAINLQGIAAQLSKLPEGNEAAVLSYLSPTQVAWLRNNNIISGDKVDAMQVIEGLRNYLSVQMRPVGSGALRGAEMDRFQASLPTLLQSPAGRQKALAFMQAYVDRVQQEADFASDYYTRPGKDGQPSYNLRGLTGAMNAPRSQGGLGEVIPHAPALNAPDADHTAFLSGIESGRPYYGWQKDPKTGQWHQDLMVKP